MPLLELPREDISGLSYERFLREYALPRQPVIIEGVGADWPAASAWCDLGYFLGHSGVDLEHEVTVSEGGAGAEELECTVGEALRKLQQREESSGGGGGGGGGSGQAPLYLSAWEYVRGGSEALQADFSVPPLFDRSPSWLAQNAVLGNAAVDMKWLYLGQVRLRDRVRVRVRLTRIRSGSLPRPGGHGLRDARGHEHDLRVAVGGPRPEGVVTLPLTLALTLALALPLALTLTRVCAHGGDYAALLAVAEQAC